MTTRSGGPSLQLRYIGTFTADDSVENADWIKSLVWDLPRDLRQFAALVLHGPTWAQARRQWLRFQALPAAQAMPEELRREVEAALADEESWRAIAIWVR